MTYQMITPKQYVYSSINKYSSLYSGKNYKLKIYDHLFNVIGNGISDINDLKFTFNIINHKNYDFVPEKYISGEDLYYVRYELNGKIGTLNEYFTKDEVSIFGPRFTPRLVNTDWSTYPNFRKEYSLIWKDGVIDFLTNEWKRECVWFYNQCFYKIVNRKMVDQDMTNQTISSLTFIQETINMVNESIKGKVS